jgi:exopolysaccharide biosynthesis polyprenyl glycosylphosphotransferase
MVSVYPMLILMVCDCIISFVLVYIYTGIYHKSNIPKNMVMIYGNNNAVNLKFKMDTRKDKYRVTRVINIDRGTEYIRKEIEQHDAVIINDIPAQIANDILKYCYHRGIRTYVVPKISDIIVRGAEDITLFDTPLLLVRGCGLTLFQRFFKRTFDLILCLVAMIPAAPIMLLVALAIKIEDHGPVFYKQKRVTLNGKVFEILKFRSMIVDAEKGGYNMGMRANGKDPRITKVGNFIRACRLDELPQILNIIRGDMSLVGPRPERVENVAEYSEKIPEFKDRLKVKGGLTGYAQIYGKYNTSAYDKLRLDLMYIENYSLLMDIKLIFMTLQIMVKPESTEGFEKIDELEEMKEALLAQEEAAATKTIDKGFRKKQV